MLGAAVKKVHFKWINFYWKRERTFPFKLWQKDLRENLFSKANRFTKLEQS